MLCLRMLFAVDLERRRALQIGPFRGYDADAADVRTRATRNEAKLKQDAEGAGRGLRIERMWARPGEGGAEVRAAKLAARTKAFEDADDGLPGRGLAAEDPERELALGVGEQRVDEAWRGGSQGDAPNVGG